jgi:hypothetical protein
VLRVLKRAEWRPFVELLSPRFFEVVPMSTVLSQARTLGGNYFNAAGFTAARQARAKTLAQARLAVELVDVLPAPSAVSASTVLELYFHQVLLGGAVLLDLRAECFAPRGEWLAWSPRPAFVTFEPEFHQGLRELYCGFYQDDATRFSAGAKGLGLQAAEGALRAQFGVGDQSRVRFSLPDFQQRFQAVFDACKASGTKLHPGFIGLGVGLATLYSHLEQTGGEHDVRAAFVRASRGVAL